jgi:hypothetical protein
MDKHLQMQADRPTALLRGRLRLAAVALITAGLIGCASAAVAPAPIATPGRGHMELLPGEAQLLTRAGIARDQLRCQADNSWSTTLRGDARFTADQILDELARLGVQLPSDQLKEARKRIIEAVFWRVILTQIVEGRLHNLGASALPGITLADGRPALLFRTGFSADPGDPGSCVQSLLDAGVRHIVNLYAGPMPTQGLEEAEKRAVEARGGSYFSARSDPQAGNWREDIRESDGPEARQAAYRAVAELIRNHILRPGGAAPRGHVQLHCGGGMHRTGMVVGVIERCLAGLPSQEVAERYKRHVGWRSEAQPGGFEAANLSFIEGFDCALLR